MTIEQVVKVCKKLKLTPDQVLCMYYRAQNKSYPLILNTKQYQELTHRKLAEKEKPTKAYLNLIEDVINNVPLNAKTIKMDSKYNNIIIMLSEVLEIEDNVHEKVEKRVRDYFRDDERLVELYFTWLYLFPSTSEGKNKGWEYLFGVKYDGVPLRKVIDSNLRNFKRTAYTEDVGAYILTTYLFIRNHIHDGKCYIPKITNFINEQEDLYINTKEDLDKLNEKELLNLFELNNETVHSVAPGMTQG